MRVTFLMPVGESPLRSVCGRMPTTSLGEKMNPYCHVGLSLSHQVPVSRSVWLPHSQPAGKKKKVVLDPTICVGQLAMHRGRCCYCTSHPCSTARAPKPHTYTNKAAHSSTALTDMWILFECPFSSPGGPPEHRVDTALIGVTAPLTIKDIFAEN